MPDSIKLSSMTLDCPDRREAGSVLRRDHRGEVIFLNEAWATVDGPGGRIDFQTPRLCAADLAGRPRRCRSIWTSTVDNLATPRHGCWRPVPPSSTSSRTRTSAVYSATPPATRSAGRHGTTFRPDQRTQRSPAFRTGPPAAPTAGPLGTRPTRTAVPARAQVDLRRDVPSPGRRRTPCPNAMHWGRLRSPRTRTGSPE